MKYLSRADEILLNAVLRLGENAYGVPIIKEVEKRSGKKLSLGSLWVALDILCKKGLLSKIVADPTPIRGGRGKIYYSITDEGISAFEQVRELNESLWKDIPDSAGSNSISDRI